MFLAGIGLFFSPLSLAESEVKIAEKNKLSSLCDTGDLIFFTCTTKNKKIISLCGKGTEDNPTGIYYRFGSKGKVEMDFPEDKGENSFEQFSKDYYFRYKVDLQNFVFHNNGYLYSLYDSYRGDEPEKGDTYDRGISVSEKGSGKVLANIKCNSGYYAANFPVLNERLKNYGE